MNVMRIPDGTYGSAASLPTRAFAGKRIARVQAI
jgi:hypothetical protein